MKSMQQVGGYASLVLGLGMAAILALIFLVLPGRGVGMNDFSNPQSVTKYGWALTAFNWIDVISGITTILLALAMRERMQSGAPNRMRLATILASVATALFLGAGIAQVFGWPLIFQTSSGGAPAIAAFYAIAFGIEGAAIFTTGWVALLWGWAGFATKGVPSLISYLLIASGILTIASYSSLALVALGLLALVLNVIWALWLAMILLKK